MDLKRLAPVVALLAVTGCSQTFAIAVVGKEVPGGIMRGEGEASLSGGTFQVSGGGLTCSGSYNSLSTSLTLNIPVLCNDGRKGIVLATREAGLAAGGGRFTLNDGTTGDFIFGPAARAL